MSVVIDPVTTAAKLVKDIAQQERTLRFAHFDSEVAYDIGTRLREKFKAGAVEKGPFAGRGIVISISLFTGHTLFSCAVGQEGEVGPDNWLWVEAKKNVVRRYGHSSFFYGRKLVADGTTPHGKGLNFPEYACHGGAFPIWLQAFPSAPIGAIIVSGLAQKDDHQLVVDVLKEYLQTPSEGN